ncbi:hypothetical protein AGR4A_pAt30009 [Agrobacterium tumefaciens str. B6]|uniref:Uncharacterized protein n=1 Tax=Agrobacterium tumefaciens str. B6 TaxID=1183423 RepID=A0A822V9A8_AGRTU|nr:hypothetical protein AGR4A_pAt30009 [Agrobacterium tumefaciens str. B6]
MQRSFKVLLRWTARSNESSFETPVLALFFYAFAACWLRLSVYQQSGLGRTPFDVGVAILAAALGFVLGPFASGSILRFSGRYPC